MSIRPTQSGTGFLSFNSMPPRLHVTAETDDFDEVIMRHWRDEGFDATYLPYNGGGKPYVDALKHLSDDLELGEAYALIAYGPAAATCLDVALKPMRHLCALVCYYPTHIPAPSATYPTQLQLLVHLAGSQPFSAKFAGYAYAGVRPGFAEHDLDEYDKVAASLAWSRTLGAVRKGFQMDEDLEAIRDEHFALEFKQKDAAAVMRTMVAEPHVNHVPTLTGGVGRKNLNRFYHDFFMPSNPPSLEVRLVSRTIGIDRVVDEMIVSFRHTQEVPWMLPGVPPTDKLVEVALVSIVRVHGGKLEHEHVYWDQASVLVQIGALDPKMVPKALKATGMQRLPVAGREAARKVLDEGSHPSNELIPKW